MSFNFLFEKPGIFLECLGNTCVTVGVDRLHRWIKLDRIPSLVITVFFLSKSSGLKITLGVNMTVKERVCLVRHEIIAHSIKMKLSQ